LNKQKPSECPTRPQSTYSPVIAAEMLFHCTSAYSKTPNGCLSNYFKGRWVLVHYTEAVCDWDHSVCAGYIAYSKEANAVVLAFRGSQTLNQVVLEALENLLPNYPWQTGGSVVPYFARTFSYLWPQLSASMKNFLSTLSNPTVYVTGHSFGGALASLASTLLVDQNIANNPILYTFGQPRTGDYHYALGFSSRVKNSWRIVHRIDPVPHIPFCGKVKLEGFPLPICSACDNKAYHHGIEVYYNFTRFPMTANSYDKQCVNEFPRNEALACSNGDAIYGLDCLGSFEKCIEYHQYYFGSVQIGKCGESDCTDNNWCNHQFSFAV
jgi:hypothetical protein